MEAFGRLSAKVAILTEDHIDTDRIIPARFLTTTDRIGLGEALFADWRFGPDGRPDPGFVLNKAEAKEAEVLVVGQNFGCGSSREHAVWALLGAGIRVVIGTKVADIFKANALRNGLLVIDLDEEAFGQLGLVNGSLVEVNMETCEVTAQSGGAISFDLDPFVRHCIRQGMDTLDFLLTQVPAITAYEERAV